MIAPWPRERQEEERPAPEWKPELRKARLTRHRQRARLYGWAVALVALSVVLSALVVANTRSVKLDWVVGSTKASLVWIILAAAIFSRVAGLLTGVLFRHHTRRRVDLQ
jgi:uncharacterized integral membrane protein